MVIEDLITKKVPKLQDWMGKRQSFFTKEASCDTNRALNLGILRRRDTVFENKEQLLGHEVNFGVIAIPNQ